MRSQGVIYEVLPFDRAYHTPLFEAYSHNLIDFPAQLPLEPPQIPLYSCTSAAPYPDDPAAMRALALEHWRSPVRQRPVLFPPGLTFRLFSQVETADSFDETWVAYTVVPPSMTPTGAVAPDKVYLPAVQLE